MKRFFLRALCGSVLIAAIATASGPLPAFAQGGQPRVAVPQLPMPRPQMLIGFEGCYRIDQAIYGPYGVSFCLSGERGNYRVGGELNCQGGLNWYRTGPDTIQIDLNRTSCGGGMAWTGDSMGCRAVGSIFSPWQDPFSPRPRVPVPDAPVPNGLFSITGMRCNYVPAAPGYQPLAVTISRLH